MSRHDQASQSKAPPRGFASQSSNKLTISAIKRLNLREAQQLRSFQPHTQRLRMKEMAK